MFQFGAPVALVPDYAIEAHGRTTVLIDGTMKISLVTPAGRQSRAGNRTTAVRWARILRDLGHRVEVSLDDDGRGADMMVAVHAWRSAAWIEVFAATHPDRPLVVLLAGTDIYGFQHSHPETTLASLDHATAIVCLHDLVLEPSWKPCPVTPGDLVLPQQLLGRVLHGTALSSLFPLPGCRLLGRGGRVL